MHFSELQALRPGLDWIIAACVVWLAMAGAALARHGASKQAEGGLDPLIALIGTALTFMFLWLALQFMP